MFVWGVSPAAGPSERVRVRDKNVGRAAPA